MREIQMESLKVNLNVSTYRTSDSNDACGSRDVLTTPEHAIIQSSPRRHLVLALFFLSAAVNGLPFSHNFVGDVFIQYYHTDYSMVNMLALLFMASFIVSFLPANWIFQKNGLRFGVLMGVFATAIGSWIFCASVRSDLFWVALVAQTVIGAGQPFLLNVPPYLASIWFPAGEVSRACALASFGAPVGILSGAAMLPAILNGKDNVTLHKQFLWYHYSYAAISSVLLILVFIVFKDQPKYAPSHARAETIRNPPKEDMWGSIRQLMTNRNYVKHLFSYGLVNGVQNAIVSVINQMILEVYPQAKDDFWKVGLLLCFTGIVSCLIFGLILDKTHKYKETALGAIIVVAISIGILTSTFNLGINVLYIVLGVVGFFVIGYLPIGLEFGAEITYPISEVSTTSLLVVAGCVVGIILTFVCTWTLETYGQLTTNLTFIGVALVALLSEAFVQPDYRRLKANQEDTNETTPNGLPAPSEVFAGL